EEVSVYEYNNKDALGGGKLSFNDTGRFKWR
ncbi:hypothetical protein L917_15890, partial [Phytophthora nicotianae]